MSPRIAWLVRSLFPVVVFALGSDGALGQVIGGAAGRVGVGGTSTTVTTMDGYDGYFFAGVWRPFVIGAIPVVGEGPGLEPPRLPKPATRTALDDRLSRLQRGERPTPRVSVSQHQPSTAAPSPATDGKPATPQARLSTAAESSAGQGAPSLSELRRRKNGR